MSDKPFKIVPFHEDGYSFLWHVYSGLVMTNKNEIVAEGCYNLADARAKTRAKLNLH